MFSSAKKKARQTVLSDEDGIEDDEAANWGGLLDLGDDSALRGLLGDGVGGFLGLAQQLQPGGLFPLGVAGG